MSGTAKIVELVRKLFAKADSAAEIGSTEEAAAFAAKANELLLRHRLEMTDLELQDEQDHDPMGRDDLLSAAWGGVQQKWSSRLASAVAHTHFCRLIFDATAGRRWRARATLLGRASDRAIALATIQMLHQQAKRLEKQAYETSDRTVSRATFRTSFLLGFTNAVYRRLHERRGTLEQQGGQYAVVRLRDADTAVMTFERAQFPHAYFAPVRLSAVHRTVYAAGQAAGASVAFGGIASGGTAARAGRLLAGGRG